MKPVESDYELLYKYSATEIARVIMTSVVIPINKICSFTVSKPSISMRNCVFSLLLDSCSPSDLR